MFGWRPVEHAKILGFTHHGSYYGIPVYLGFKREEAHFKKYGPMVAVKWPPSKFLFTLMVEVEALIALFSDKENPPYTKLKVGDPL